MEAAKDGAGDEGVRRSVVGGSVPVGTDIGLKGEVDDLVLALVWQKKKDKDRDREGNWEDERGCD